MDDGVVSGLGTHNPKGHGAAVVMAAIALKQAEVPLLGDVVVAFGMPTDRRPGEAGGRFDVGHGAGCAFMLEQGIRGDFAIVAKPGPVAWQEVGLCWFRIRVKGLLGYAGTRHVVKHLNPIVEATKVIAGIRDVSTVLLLATLSVTTASEKPSKGSPLALAAVVLTGATLVYATFDMPRLGDPDSPANRSPITRIYIDSAKQPAEHGGADSHGESGPSYEVGIPNTVTTVLASFRGYDTMGETAVIFTAGFASGSRLIADLAKSAASIGRKGIPLRRLDVRRSR